MIDVSQLTVSELLEIKERLSQLKRPYKSKYAELSKTWNWSKSDTAIAREHKVHVRTVIEWRKKLGRPASPRDYDLLPRPIRSKTKVNWEAQDWELTDIELARANNVTREYVRQIRAKLGKPKRLSYQKNFEAFKQMCEGVESLNYTDTNARFPIAMATFYSYCERLGIKVVRNTTRSTIPWDKMNFELPNNLLTEVWGLNQNSAAAYRCNHGLGKAAFHHCIGDILEALLVAYEEEKRKAIKTQLPQTSQASSPPVEPT